MPLFLAGLLVRGGALAPEAAEEALQRQALLGGALDTSLLELGCIDEETVLPYLSRASGLPPLPAGALDGTLDPSLREAVTRKAAERFGVVPFAWDGGTLQVACCHPAENTPFREIASSAARVEGYMAPEIRVRMAIGRLHGSIVAPRFQELAAKLHFDDGTTTLHADPASAPASGHAGSPSREEAFSLLGSAADRDDALAVLLRFARQHFEMAAALAVSGKSLVGWDALGPEPGAAARIKRLSFPLEEASVLRLVVETGGPYLGPLGERDCARDLESALGRKAPQVALVVPITVANRTVALLFAENGDNPISPVHVEPVMHVAQAVGPALEKLIRARKAGRPGPAPRSPARAASAAASSIGARASAVAMASPGAVAVVTPAPVPASAVPSSAVSSSAVSSSAVSSSAVSSSAVPTEFANSARDEVASIVASASGAASGNVVVSPGLTPPGEPVLHLPKVERRRPEPVDSPIEPARRAVECALAARTADELEAALPAVREVADLAAQMLVALLPGDAALGTEGDLRVARVLELLGASAIPALARAAASPSRGVRLQAARLAAALDGNEAATLLAALSSDEDPEVAVVARRASQP